MTEQNQEVYVPDQDIETIDVTDRILQAAQKRSGLIEKVIKLGIEATNAGDWVDQSGTPYMTGSGAEKVRARFALKIWDVKTEKTNEADEEGGYYYFTTSGKVGFNESEYLQSMGTCSSRDQFFAKRAGKVLPMSEVDITNIKKSAYTNFLVNGITRFLGMRNLTWDLLKECGIDKGKVAKVEYTKGQQKANWADEQKTMAKRIGDCILANMDGDKNKAGDQLEKMTAFKTKDGKSVSGKKHMKDLSGKRIEILFKKMKKDIEEFEGAGMKSQETQQDDLPPDLEPQQ